MLVVICKLPETLARTVSELQVTVTGPAGMLAVEVNVSLRASVLLVNVVPADNDGTETTHAVLAAVAVIRLLLDGKTREMKSLVPLIAVAVVKDMVAAPAVVGLVENPDSVGRVTQPTQGVATCAA